MKKLRTSDKNKGVIACISIGVVLTVVISLILTTILSSLVQKGSLSDKINACVFLIRLVATLLGCVIGASISKKNALAVIGAISVSYYLILLIVGLLLFNGTLHNALNGMVSVLAGGLVSCLINLKPQRSKRKAVRFAR